MKGKGNVMTYVLIADPPVRRNNRSFNTVVNGHMRIDKRDAFQPEDMAETPMS